MNPYQNWIMMKTPHANGGAQMFSWATRPITTSTKATGIATI